MCVGCGAGQPVRCADLLFIHTANCDRGTGFGKHPCQELAELLAQQPTV